MDAFPRREIGSLLLLSLVAGSADAAGYMGLGRVFTSNMTGNVVLLGIDLGQRHFGEALHSAYVLVIFMAGVALGTGMTDGLEKPSASIVLRRILPLETGLLIIFAVFWALRRHPTPDASYGLVTFLALAMGLQTSAFNQSRIPGVATTAITSTLTTLVTGAVEKLAPRPSTAQEIPGTSRFVFQGTFLALYLAGAIVSGLVMIEEPRLIGLLPAVVVLGVALHLLKHHDV